MTDDIDKYVVNKLYEVVKSPEQYDEFMLSLQAKMDSMREMDEGEAADQLQSHFDRAYSLVDIISPWRADSESSLQSFDTISLQAMLAVDRYGKIVDANNAARVLYDLTPDAALDNLPLAVEELEHLRKLTVDVIEGKNNRNNPNDVIRFDNQTTQRHLFLTLTPYVEEASQRTLAIMKTGDINWPPHLGPILSDLFQLTTAEIEVIRLLVSGEKVESIANIRNNSVSTVRTQLRSIYAKTRTESQTDCIRLTIGLALMHNNEDGRTVAKRIQVSQDLRAYPRPENREIFTLENGRQIEYAVFGAANGQAILFYHDQVFGDIWFPSAVEQAIADGLKIISVLRPGFGHTTLYEKPASDPRKFAPDVLELLEHLGIDRLTIIAMRGGCVHALALAAIIPDRIAGITFSNPFLPVRSDEDLEGTNGYNRLIPHTRMHFPRALKFMVRTGFAFVTAKGPEAFVTSVLRASPKDIDWASRPDVMSILVQCLYVHHENGYKGSYGDIAYSEDWSDLLENSPAPVRMVIGADDRNVQWGAAKRWAAAHEHIELITLPNSGYFVLHQHSSRFLKWAKEDLKLLAKRK